MMLYSRIQNTVLRALANVLSPQGRKSRLLVLTYHRVLKAQDSLLDDNLDAVTFEWHMQLLREQFTVLSLSEATARLQEGTLPARAVCVTFDDGYADNFEVALPVLQKWGIPATVFVATGFLDGGRMWNDSVIETIRLTKHDQLNLDFIGMGVESLETLEQRRQLLPRVLNAIKYHSISERLNKVNQLVALGKATLPDNLMMSSDQVRMLRGAGIEVGAHTVNHPILSQLSLEEAEGEIAGSRDFLCDLLDEPVDSFAYPNGRPGVDYHPCHVDVLRKTGFKVAVSTAWGGASASSDMMQLPRIAPWDQTPLKFNLRMLRTYLGEEAACVK